MFALFAGRRKTNTSPGAGITAHPSMVGIPSRLAAKRLGERHSGRPNTRRRTDFCRPGSRACPTAFDLSARHSPLLLGLTQSRSGWGSIRKSGSPSRQSSPHSKNPFQKHPSPAHSGIPSEGTTFLTLSMTSTLNSAFSRAPTDLIKLSWHQQVIAKLMENSRSSECDRMSVPELRMRKYWSSKPRLAEVIVRTIPCFPPRSFGFIYVHKFSYNKCLTPVKCTMGYRACILQLARATT